LRNSKSIALVVLCVLGISVFSTINNAYATDDITVTKTTVSGATNNECSAIGETATTNYVFAVCGTASSTSQNVRVFSGTTQIASVALTLPSTSDDIRVKIFPIDNSKVVVETGSPGSGIAMFREYQIVGSTLTNTRTFNAPCTIGAWGAYDQEGTSVFFVCTDGTLREFGLLTFTQLNSYTGFTSGSPTCTTPRGVTMATSTVGIVACDTAQFIIFHISGATVVKDEGVTTSVATNAQPHRMIYTNGYIYFYRPLSESPYALGVDPVTRTFTVSPEISVLTGAGTDFQIASGGYYLVVDRTNSQVTVLNANQAPPNNLVFTKGLGSTVGQTININSYDSLHFIVSKGDNGNSTIFYFKLSDLLINGSPPSGGGGGTGSTGGVDCTDPAFSYRLICNVGNGGLTGASNLLNQSSTNILCQVGLIACTQDPNGNFNANNPDIKTNGVGYILVAIAIALFVGILWVASRGQLTEIPTFIWFIGTIAIVGTITAFGWIDPTFLIITIITIVAFAVAKARGIFGGQTVFAGE
jgi:hypothetical protein